MNSNVIEAKTYLWSQLEDGRDYRFLHNHYTQSADLMTRCEQIIQTLGVALAESIPYEGVTWFSVPDNDVEGICFCLLLRERRNDGRPKLTIRACWIDTNTMNEIEHPVLLAMSLLSSKEQIFTTGKASITLSSISKKESPKSLVAFRNMDNEDGISVVDLTIEDALTAWYELSLKSTNSKDNELSCSVLMLAVPQNSQVFKRIRNSDIARCFNKMIRCTPVICQNCKQEPCICNATYTTQRTIYDDATDLIQRIPESIESNMKSKLKEVKSLQINLIDCLQNNRRRNFLVYDELGRISLYVRKLTDGFVSTNFTSLYDGNTGRTIDKLYRWCEQLAKDRGISLPKNLDNDQDISSKFSKGVCQKCRRAICNCHESAAKITTGQSRQSCEHAISSIGLIEGDLYSHYKYIYDITEKLCNHMDELVKKIRSGDDSSLRGILQSISDLKTFFKNTGEKCAKSIDNRLSSLNEMIQNAEYQNRKEKIDKVKRNIKMVFSILFDSKFILFVLLVILVGGFMTGAIKICWPPDGSKVNKKITTQKNDQSQSKKTPSGSKVNKTKTMQKNDQSKSKNNQRNQ